MTSVCLVLKLVTLLLCICEISREQIKNERFILDSQLDN